MEFSSEARREFFLSTSKIASEFTEPAVDILEFLTHAACHANSRDL
jgi:hypothetical protein